MLDSLLNKKCLDVLHSSSVKDFSRRMIEFSQQLGFNTVAALVVTDHSPTLTEFQSVSNAPEGYLKDFENLELGRIDPVSQYCKHSSSPILWNRAIYKSREERELWERQAAYGYRCGISVATHPGKGRHFMFGAEWDCDHWESVRHYKQAVEDLLMFGAHAQAAAFELCLPASQTAQNEGTVSRGELEALRWTMDGRTSWEVGEAMSISERHATLLIRRAMCKLECSTKYETVLRAIQLGLIQSQ